MSFVSFRLTPIVRDGRSDTSNEEVTPLATRAGREETMEGANTRLKGLGTLIWVEAGTHGAPGRFGLRLTSAEPLTELDAPEGTNGREPSLVGGRGMGFILLLFLSACAVSCMVGRCDDAAVELSRVDSPGMAASSSYVWNKDESPNTGAICTL